MLSGKKILLGVCGSIAAYENAYIIRLLVKAGAEVKVSTTEAATDFISPLTLSTLSKNGVLTDFAGDDESWNSHVDLGLWADVFLIAPASANTIAKFANGICDNLLTATYLSSRCPVILAPAMDVDMWHHPATKKNVTQLADFGNKIIPVEKGELASGLVGEGRMAEPEEIISYLEKHFKGQKKNQTPKRLAGCKVLLTAGPTIEPIDPVRYISNHSTGKMGLALAEALLNEGAEVTLVMGPSHEQYSLSGIKVIPVYTAEEMYNATMATFKGMDIAIMAAAVSDFTPATAEKSKIKKAAGKSLSLKLVKTKDILRALGKQKKKGQLLVGFALETDDETQNAKEKLREKNLDLIVLNSLQDKGAGFGYDTNKITIFKRDNSEKAYPLKTKKEVAVNIIDEIVNLTDD